MTINWHALFFAPIALLLKRSLLVPDMTVQKLSEIDVESLAAAGITGALIDSDDTLLSSRDGELFPEAALFVDACKNTWGRRVFVFSDSAGTHRDTNGTFAARVSDRTGIEVLPHSPDKPGGITAVREALGPPEKLVVVGDRLLTDIVFGNRYGCKTIWVRRENPNAPFSRFERLFLRKK